jgi:hypothetical protein
MKNSNILRKRLCFFAKKANLNLESCLRITNNEIAKGLDRHELNRRAAETVMSKEPDAAV